MWLTSASALASEPQGVRRGARAETLSPTGREFPASLSELPHGLEPSMAETSLDRAALVALLDFYVEAGVDCALDESPHDRFANDAAAPVGDAEARQAVASPAPRPRHPLLERAPEPRPLPR